MQIHMANSGSGKERYGLPNHSNRVIPSPLTAPFCLNIMNCKGRLKYFSKNVYTDTAQTLVSSVQFTLYQKFGCVVLRKTVASALLFGLRSFVALLAVAIV